MPYNDERRPGGSGALMSSGDNPQGTNTVRQMAGGEPIGWPPPPCPCSICVGLADPVQPQQRRSGTAWCHRCRSRHLRTDPFCVARRAGGAA